jgi:flagellar basal-body rod protein FlgG
MTTAATGMKAQQLNIDTIANNLANVDTTGFKKSAAEFQDLLYEVVNPGGSTRGSGLSNSSRVEVGHGVKLSATHRNFRQGALMQTANPLDLVIEGDGFFQLRLPDGTIGYTRDGSLKMDADRNVVTSAGYFMEPPLQIPEDAIEISIARDGTVSVIIAGNDSTIQDIGQVELVRFPNPTGMRNRGGNIFLESPASGAPVLGVPGEEGLGEVSQGYLEMSNVETVDELIKMIAAQRAYELNAKTISIGDDLLQIVAQLKR